MPLWSYPAVVNAVTADGIHATLDLGCRLYVDTVVRVAGLSTTARHTEQLTALLPPGTRALVTSEPLTGAPVKAHLTLVDGRDVARTVRGRGSTVTPTAAHGGTLDKVWSYPAAVVHVTDGDTFQARIATGSPVDYHLPVRVAHVNAPEKATPDGQSALVWAERVLIPGLPVTVVATRLEKYGRLLGSVVLADGADYATALLAAGHAVPYEGGSR
jgi:micrococcal nuclease